jgi:4'-phosphopantetheinyl transferase
VIAGPPSAVDVWRVELDADPRRAAGLLSTAESERAARLRAERHRRRFAVAHGALRAILARYLDADPRAIELETGPHGKPELAGSPELQFNLTHSGALAIVAVARGRRVGVDVELVRPVRYRERLVERLFSGGEAGACAGPGEPDRSFLQIWARKEALLKAVGVGIGEHLGDVSIPEDEATVEFDGLSWSVRDLAPGDDYVGALAAEGSGLTVRLRRYELD